MGCASGRDKSAEEQALEKAENSLRYENLEITGVVKAHQSNCAEGKCSEEQWKEIAKSLKLAISEENPSSAIVEFYKEFRSDKISYDCKSLVLLAVLLCKGTGHARADAVFELYTALDSMKTEEVGAIFDDIFRISLEQLPRLVSEEDVKKEVLEDYLLTARLGVDKSKSYILAGVSGGLETVNKKEFLAWFGKGDNHRWLESSELRGNLRANGKAAHAALVSKKEEEAKAAENKTEVLGGKHEEEHADHEGGAKGKHHEAKHEGEHEAVHEGEHEGKHEGKHEGEHEGKHEGKHGEAHVDEHEHHEESHKHQEANVKLREDSEVNGHKDD